MALWHSDLYDLKPWRLRKMATDKRKALSYARTHPGGLHRLMIESLESDLAMIAAELKRQASVQAAG